MVVLYTKLKRLTLELRKWNKECFGNVFLNVQKAKQNFMEAKKMVEHNHFKASVEGLYRT